uniref:Uncharacterized protein n=1 Tax=Rhizophora mucronata TaxID=61149 RepID=A0A2P2KK82_RHIMU
MKFSYLHFRKLMATMPLNFRISSTEGSRISPSFPRTSCFERCQTASLAV